MFIHGSATGNLVAGNYIGSDVTGTIPLGNSLSGVEIADSAWNNTIGGTTAGDRNVISGSVQGGVLIDDSATGNLVAGNYIGTDLTGTKALGNAYSGVEIADSAWNNTIGGTTAGDRNVISGNAQAGVFIHGSATGNLVAGNFIGTNVTGTKALGNAYSGVEIADSAWNNTIGGTTAGDRNVISGNAKGGVFIHDSATGNLVAGNYIGSDVTGSRRLGNSFAGVEIAASASKNTIGGTAAGDRNVISGNAWAGVFIHDSATGNLVAGNYIGSDVTGTIPLGNSLSGVEIADSAWNNTIGGTTAGDRNVISGSVQGGVLIDDSATGNLVAGNYIGTDLTGTKALGNAYSGVEIADSAWNNTIGGTTAGDRNVISGNAQAGVFIHGSATGNLVAGNFIGTNVTGTKALGNAYSGVEIADSAWNNTIGGTTAGDRNVISGNAKDGVFIHDSATGNLVEGNFIGTDLTGTKALGNADSGVLIDGGATNNTIGGTGAGAGNIISANHDYGLLITGSGTTGNLVQGNTIGTDITGTVVLGNTQGGGQVDDGAANNTIGGLTTSDGVLHGFDFVSASSSVALTLRGDLSGPPQGQTSGGPTVVYRIDVEMDRMLLAIVHPEGFTVRLMILDSQGQVLVQSDGLSSTDPDSVIDQYLAGGNYSLVVESTGGAGTYALTTMLMPASASLQPIPVGSEPDAIVAGDFTGDGRTDLAVANYDDNTVSVLLGNGDGTFQPQVTYAVGVSPRAIVAGDFNGDDRTDLAVANYGSNDVSVLLGNGNGTFQNQVTYAVGSEPYALVAGDFTGDGHTDLAVANYGSNDVSILPGKGNGTFQNQVTYAAGNEPEAIVAGDFTGDGRTDLAVANYGSNDMSVLLGKGNGTFQNQVTYAVGNEPDAIVAGDFTGDGRTDLAVANYGDNDVSILLGNGHGTFQNQVTYAVSTEPIALVTGDFNGDGRTDLAVANYYDWDVSVLLGNGDGTFQDQMTYRVGDWPEAIVAGDFNGDGRTDLAVANYGSNDVSVLLGNGDGTFQGQGLNVVGGGPPAIVAGDFTGDGRTDLAVANEGGNVSVLLGNGDGTFQNQVTYAVGSDPYAIVTGDFNGDGRTDLAVANSGSNDVSILLGNGDGTFQKQVTYAVGTDPIAIVAGDFTGNGRTDLAVANYDDNTVSILLGNGDGTFQNQVTYAVGSEPHALVAGDFTGDGRTDLAVANYGSNDVSVLLGNGNGTFQNQVTYAVGSEPYSLVAGDFTSDGRTDLAVANYGSNDVSVLLGNGNGTFQNQVTYPVGNEPEAIVAGDFNGDDRTDLAVANYGSNDVSILLGNGHGTFQNQVTYAVGRGPITLVTGDFNGDGRTDLAVANYDDNDVSILLGKGDGTFVAPGQFATTPRATPLVADVNGDGTADVLVVDGAGNILYRQGIPRKPGTFEPPVTVNPGTPSRDIAWVPDTNQGPVLASVDAHDNAISLYAYRDGRFVKVGSLATGFLPAQIIAADLKGDGRTDLVVRNAGDGTLSVFFAFANTFTGPINSQVDFQTFLPPVPLPVGLGVSDVQAVDTTGSGRLDLVVTNKLTGQVSVLQNLGNGTFAPPEPYRAGTGLSGIDLSSGSPEVTSMEATTDVAAGPFTTGAPTDLLTANPGSNTLGLLAGLGGGRFANPVDIPTAEPAQVVCVADFNHDGIPDVAVLGNDTVSIYLGNGRGGFSAPVSYNAGLDPTGLTVADLEHNGKLDLLIGNEYGDVLVLKGQGDGTFRPLLDLGNSVALAVADLTGNGTKDIIYASQNLDNVVVDYGGGQRVSVGASSGLLAPGAVAVADLNDDGKPYLIVANSGGNNVLVYPGLGNGQFGRELKGGKGFFTGTDPVGVTVARLNGRLDLVVADRGSNDVTVLLNQATADGFTFVPGPRLNLKTATQQGIGPVATAIVPSSTGGPPSLAVSVSGSNQVWLIPGVGGGFFNDQNPTIFSVGSQPGPLFVGNFTRPGQLDLVTVNAGSNDLTLIPDFLHGGQPREISSGGTDPVAAFEFSSGSGFDNLVVANNDGIFALLEGGPDGLNLTSTETAPGLPNPTDLAFLAFTGGQVQFYAATEGSEFATLLTFQLGLQPLRDAALPLIATLLTLTIETSTAEFDLSATNGEAAAAVSFLPVSTLTVGQSLSEHAGTGESESGDDEEPNEPKEPNLPVAQESSSWQPFLMGLDEALDQFCRDSLDQFMSRDEPAPDKAQPPHALNKPLNLWQRDQASPEARGTIGTDSNHLPQANQGQIIDEAIRLLWADESRPVRTSLTPTSVPLTSDGTTPAETAPADATLLSTEPVQRQDGPLLSSYERGFEALTECAGALLLAAFAARRIDPPGTRHCTPTNPFSSLRLLRRTG